jgi:hypothetical protein
MAKPLGDLSGPGKSAIVAGHMTGLVCRSGITTLEFRSRGYVNKDALGTTLRGCDGAPGVENVSCRSLESPVMTLEGLIG